MPKLIKMIRSLLTKRRPFSADTSIMPLIASTDFYVGERLCVYGRYLYIHDPTGQLPPAFIAGRNIKAGEVVFTHSPDPKRSDVVAIVREINER